MENFQVEVKEKSWALNVENEKIEFNDFASKDAAECKVFPRILHFMDVCAAILLARISEQGRRKMEK